ncbi:MAG: tRNA (guanosine(46)-N7)-methyltransferase TrmB [Bacteroidales bacterium]|nr:tRNA (guanosine(46)-N7)-methyltransferase TrmB [Bacteroidales bacterium]
MGRPSKLKRFAEMREFQHVFEPDGQSIMTTDYPMKGRWHHDFFKNEAPITLELGCGKGEYTVGLAARYPGRNFIGIDIKGARMWKGAKASLLAGMNNVAFIRSRVEFIHRLFASDEVSEIWITFPDPQPKNPNKRLMSSRFLMSYNGILSDRGLVHLKTDSKMLYEYMLALLRENGIEPKFASSDLYKTGGAEDVLSLKTHYEESFLAVGKMITYIELCLPKGVHLREPVGFDSTIWDE